MPALLLQKPSRKSKAKDHKIALEKRMKLWEEGKILELLQEGKTIQDRLINSTNRNTSIKDTSRKFIERMSKGNVNGAIKLPGDNMVNGIIPLTKGTLEKLKEKHPEGKAAESEVRERV